VRKLLIASVLVAAAGLTAAFSAGATPAASASSAVRVKVGDNYFVRARGVPKVTVAKGRRVRWVWTGKRPHNVQAIRGPSRFGSTPMTNGSYTKRLRKRGTYTIICTIHGGDDQKMKLIVE
jgi:plastocyanin